ncbi:MAG: Spy/CpxP family protein refolding chaperone [Planctomycetes bacterium]|nr:Spy/CpxP family protein refolding chaperone [Planctomycetota bacterium]
MRKVLSLFLAAFLMTGAASYVRAEDDADLTDDAEYMIVVDDDVDMDDDSPSYGRPLWGGPGRGMMPRHMMEDGPGFHRGMGPGMGRGHFGRHDGPGGPGFGPRGPRMRDMHGMKGMHRFMDLDLTDAQKSQIVDILTDNYKQTLEARFALMDAKKALGDVYDQDHADQAAIVSAHEALGAATGRLAALKRGCYDRVSGILTPEQRELLDRPMKPDRRERMDRPDRPDRRDRKDRPDRPDRPGKRDRDDRGPRHGGPRR